MQAAASIRYLNRQELDARKWDNCIAASANGLPYAYSIYLDHMSRQWGGLVLGDYEAVMPVTFNVKYGIRYMYQPAFTAQLGVFGRQVTLALVEAFIEAIPKKVRLIEIELNQANHLPGSRLPLLEVHTGSVSQSTTTAQGLPAAQSKFSGFVTQRNNYVLDLGQPYETLYARYRENIRRNIKKAQQLNHRYETGIPISEVISLSKSQMQGISNLTEKDYLNFGSLFNELLKQNKALACGVFDARDQLVASCAYVISNGRACYIMVGNHPNGRTSGASHFLIDRFIHQHAGQPLLLDFEGSDIRNLAFFYSSFGATLETYPSLRMDRLPYFIRLLRSLGSRSRPLGS